MRFWVMKTFREWSNDFLKTGKERYIGIDQEGFDMDYRKMTDTNIAILTGTTGATDGSALPPIATPAVARFFENFCYDMQIGDMVTIGIGSTTNFNVRAIARVVSDYEFVEDREEPRHIRLIKVINNFPTPVPYPEYNRFARLEVVTEMDYGRMVHKIFK